MPGLKFKSSLFVLVGFILIGDGSVSVRATFARVEGGRGQGILLVGARGVVVGGLVAGGQVAKVTHLASLCLQ